MELVVLTNNKITRRKTLKENRSMMEVATIVNIKLYKKYNEWHKGNDTQGITKRSTHNISLLIDVNLSS